MITSACCTSIRLVVIAPRPKLAPSAGTVAEGQRRAAGPRVTGPIARKSLAIKSGAPLSSPDAQCGQTRGNALGSLIRSEAAAASTGVRSIPPPTTAVPAVAPYLRKSRRDRLITTLLFGNEVERPEAA